MIKNKRLFFACFYGFFFVCVFFFAKIQYKENILIMVPASIQKEVSLFQSSPLSKKFFIAAETDNPAAMPETLRLVSAELSGAAQITPAGETGIEFLLSYYYHLPALWDEKLEAEISPLLGAKSAEAKMQENIMRLMGPEGAFARDIILADPLGLLGAAAQRLGALNITGGGLSFNSGYLSSEDGTKALLLYDTEEDTFDRAGAAALTAKVQEINKLLPAGTRVFSMGAARYTQENNDIIAKDVKRILAVSVALMLLVFLLFFRSKDALFVYLVPGLVLVPSAVFTYFIFGNISGITLGFGAVLMGLAIDYSVYMYFALKSAPVNSSPFNTAKKMLHPIVLSAATSIISFTVLYFSGIPLFRQIGVFAVGGLLYALFIAFAAGPLVFKVKGEPEKEIKLAGRVNRGVAAGVITLVLICGIFSAGFLRLDTSLDSLNTVSEEFEKDRAAFDSVTGDVSHGGALLFVFGEDRDDALDKSAALAALSGEKLPLSEILVSAETAALNKQRWHKFWTPAKINSLEQTIKPLAVSYGLKSAAFDGFLKFLKTGEAPQGAEKFDLTAVYNPFTEFEGRAAVVHVISNDRFQIPAVFAEDAALISQNLIQKDLFYSVMKTLFIIIFIVLVLDFSLIMLVFKNARLALLSFIPILCALALLITVLAVFRVRVNLFSLFSLPLIIGLGVDYAIFIIHQHLSSAELHPSRAVAAAALLSLAGFGSLVFASHKVLFAIGLTVGIGITAAALAAIYLLPPLLKNHKKIISVLFVFLLLGCTMKNVKINYNAPAPALAPASKTGEYYGELGGQMLFGAAAACEECENVRVIILSDLGVKLADLTVSDGAADVHFYPGFLPKGAVNALGRFFSVFYFDRDSLKKTVLDSGKISYNSTDGNVTLWTINENDR